MPAGRSRVKTTVNTSDLLLLIEQTEIDIFYDHFLELLCWQVARRSRVTTTVNTSSANGRASYYCADYRLDALIRFMRIEESITDWLAVKRGVLIEFDLETTPLEIMTDSAFGSDEELKVNFLSAQGETAGGISILLEAAPRYRFHDCMNPAISFPTTLSYDTTKIWRITLARFSSETRVKINCNNKEVLNVVLSDGMCGHVSNWRSYWEKYTKKIKFPYGAADYYRAYSYTPGTRNYIFANILSACCVYRFTCNII